MSERRMFAKTIIDSDAFLDMPLSTQALYFHLSMRADDEGFINNPKKIQRMIGASDDDLKVLVAKNFVIPFESGIVVIKHWRIHNYIRGDRLHETKYTEEKSLLEVKENGAYTLCLSSDRQVSDNRSTEVRLGKVSLGEDNNNRERAEYLMNLYHEHCPSLPKVLKLSDKRIKSANARYKEYSLEQITDVFDKAEASNFLKNGSGTWKGADFEWILNPNNFIKIMEGNYQNKTESKSGYDLYRTTKSSGYDFETLERESRR